MLDDADAPGNRRADRVPAELHLQIVDRGLVAEDRRLARSRPRSWRCRG